MKKNFTLVLLIGLLLGSFASASAVDMPFNLTKTFDGQIKVQAYPTYSWDVEYGNPWNIPGSGTLITHIFGQNKFLPLNVWAPYWFRIRYRDSFGSPGAWSQIENYTPCTTEIAAGHQYNFDAWNGNDCWNGVKFGQLPYSSSSSLSMAIDSEIYHGTSGASARLSSTTPGGNTHFNALVSPKVSDLSTDKKITFWIYNYYGTYGGGLKVGTMSDPYNASTFQSLATIPVNSGGGWQQKTVFLNNYNGVDEYIVFKFTEEWQGTEHIYIDDISYEQNVNCFDVTGISASNIGEQSAQINFTAPGQSTWELSVKNMTLGMTDIYTIDQYPYQLTNLVGNTPYEIKIRASCGNNLFSNWSPPMTFTTVCQQYGAGYFTSFGSVTQVDPCWTKTLTGNMTVASLANVSNGFTPVILPKSGLRMIEFKNSTPIVTNTGILATPYLSDLNNQKRVRFNLIARSTYIYMNQSPLIVGTMSDPSDPATFVPIESIDPLAMAEYVNMNTPVYWKEHTVSFAGYDNALGHHYIALKHGNAANNNIFYIDDFTYEQTPACQEPLYPEMVSSTHDSAIVGWEDALVSSYSEWQIEYGLSGFAPGSGTVVTVNANPATLTGVPLDDMQYEFYVRGKCGGVYSNWSDVGRFRTRCTGVTVGYEEGFENDPIDGFNSCWTRLTPIIRQLSFQPWAFIASVSTATPGQLAHTGTRSVRFKVAETTGYLTFFEKTILVTPKLLDFNNQKKVAFWMYCPESAYSEPEEIIVGTLSDPTDHTTFTPYHSITNASQNLDQWVRYEIDFAGYSGTDMHVGIRHAVENDGHQVFIDDFEYIQVECPRPTHLQAAQSGTSSVSLSWNNNAPTVSGFEVEYGPIGFAAGTGTLVAVNSNPHELGSLNLFAKYEFRVRNQCGASGWSDWSDRHPFKVTCSVSAPFSEYFEQYDASQSNSQNGIPNFCWTMPNHFSAGLTQLCVETVNSCSNVGLLLELITGQTEPGILISPYLSDFDNTKRVKFWATNYFNAEIPAEITVGTMSNPLDRSTFVPYETVSLEGAPANGREFVVDFSNYTGNARHIAFEHIESDQIIYTYLDNIHYQTIPVCSEPINVMIDHFSENSAAISWQAQDGATAYKIEYGSSGFAIGSGTVLQVSGTSAVLQNLSPQTQYDYYIQSICDAPSLNIGPYSFKTTCTATSVPWMETFASLPAYGAALLPDCFKSTVNIVSMQASVSTPQWYDYDNVMSGYDDTYYLKLNEGFSSHIVTPVFNLQAGTSYRFRIMARKAYEYASFVIKGWVGRGNIFSMMGTSLWAQGTIHEFSGYSPVDYTYTPMVSATHGFYFSPQASGGLNAILDRFSLEEAYTELVSGSNEQFGFESGPSAKILLEQTNGNQILVAQETPANKAVKMVGNANSVNWVSDTNWENSENFTTKANFKFVSQVSQPLYLLFDLKQTFGEAPAHSRFRVMVNGVQVGDEILASSQSALTAVERDLSNFTGSDLRISLQHVGRSADDVAWLDNIRFSDTQLGNPDNHFAELSVYPNPSRSKIQIRNGASIDEVTIFSTTGQELLKLQVNSRDTAVDMASFAAGLYFVNVSSNGYSKTVRIIKH